MKRSVPTLVQVSNETRAGDGPHYVCDRASGLLHLPGDEVPAIERMLRREADALAGVSLPDTVLTKVPARDVPDPDVIRSGTVWRFDDLQTELQKVAPDPDVIRARRNQLD
jgi:hypothetical protein